MRLCRRSSRTRRPVRRDAIHRALTAPSCSLARLGMAGMPWPGADPHLALAALLVELEVLGLKSTGGEIVFVRSDDDAAQQRAQRLLALIADHDAHGWPSQAVLHQEILELFPARGFAA